MRFDVAVGRRRERDLLLDRFRAARAGCGQAVFVTGEAGLGKSCFVLECRRALAEAGEALTWLAGRCIAFGESIPFLPLIDQIREQVHIQDFDGEPEMIAAVIGRQCQVRLLERLTDLRGPRSLTKTLQELYATFTALLQLSSRHRS